MTTAHELLPQTAASLDLKQPMIFCPRCHVQIRETDHYCYNCGKGLKRGYGFLYTHTGIILMALVLGPFALPFVWLSKKIGALSKIIYTLALLALGYYIFITFKSAYVTLQDTLKGMNNLSDLQNMSNVPGFTSINF